MPNSSYCQADFSCWQFQEGSSIPWHYKTQCHGDADGLMVGPFRINSLDLAILQACNPLPCNIEDWRYDARADFNRDFAITSADTTILYTWSSKLFVPADCSQKLELLPLSKSCFLVGDDCLIEWDWNYFYTYVGIPSPVDHPGNIRLSYSIDMGQNWNPITIITDYNIREYQWQIPDVNSTECMVMIEDIAHLGLAETWGDFSIFQCRLDIEGDLNGDCYVTFDDLFIITNSWLASDCNAANQWCGGADMDEDNWVTLPDYSQMSMDWGDCANPCDSNCQ